MTQMVHLGPNDTKKDSEFQSVMGSILQWRRVVLKSMEWASRLGRRGKCKERKKITTWV